MQFSVRMIRFVAAMAFASALLAAGAHAEALNAVPWGFSVTFGCQSQLGSQTIKTDAGSVVMTSYSCDTGDMSYFVAIIDYPTGTFTPEKVDNAYAGAVNGEATSAKGTIRSVEPFTLGAVTGRDALIDVAESHQTFHSRLFLVGDRLYQVLFVAPTGQENGKDSLDFLNSFALQSAGK